MLHVCVCLPLRGVLIVGMDILSACAGWAFTGFTGSGSGSIISGTPPNHFQQVCKETMRFFPPGFIVHGKSCVLIGQCSCVLGVSIFTAAFHKLSCPMLDLISNRQHRKQIFISILLKCNFRGNQDKLMSCQSINQWMQLIMQINEHKIIETCRTTF